MAMGLNSKLLLCALVVPIAGPLFAQDLAPRAYLITPKNSNAIVLTWSYYDGGLNFNGAIPISDARGTFSVPILSYYRSFGFLGRSANITASLPYGVGTFGVTSLNSIENLATRQTASRLGATAALRIAKHQSLKISYSGGTYLRFGSDYRNVQIAWQYSWIDRPKSSNASR